MVLGEKEAVVPARAVVTPARPEPDFEPAWAAAKAMADAPPQWRHDPFQPPAAQAAPVEQYAPAPAEETVSGEHAAAPEHMAAEPEHIAQEPAAEYAGQVAETAAPYEMAQTQFGDASVEEPAMHEAAEPATGHAELSDYIQIPVEAIQIAFKHFGTPQSIAQIPMPPLETAPPLDPAGAGAAVAAREEAMNASQ